ncbi:unnamed protein product, partial [marine sediment metagenome]
ASKDILSADIVGAKALGIEPSDVPHLVQAAEDRNRSTSLSEIEIVGEKIETVASHHDWEFIYNEAGDLPLPFYRRQFKGLKYKRYDTTMRLIDLFYELFHPLRGHVLKYKFHQ